MYTKWISYKRILTLFAAFFIVFAGYTQSDEKKALEEKRSRLQDEIKQINSLLSKERLERRSVLDQVDDIDQKIRVRRELIKVTNQQANILNRQLNSNINKIATLRKELTFIKEDYAQMIVKSYKSKSNQSKLMFLLSSRNFLQAYKRLQYMKQYSNYQKEQGKKIQLKTEELQQLNSALIDQRQEKRKLSQENIEEQNRLEKEKKTQQVLLTSIKKNEKRYRVQIDKKRKEAALLDRQIERLIRAAIVESNKKSGNTKNTATFILTPEAKTLAVNFESNKGALIWPVERGVKRRGFGSYADPVYPGVKHFNNGVVLAAEKGTKARAVFEGEVSAIIAIPGGNKAVQLRHGNYITTYYNLSKVYVKKGDKVAIKDELGEIFTSRSSGKTELKFFLYKNTSRLNPEDWVYRM